VNDQNRKLFLKLGPGYFGLWLVLWLVLASKFYLIRDFAMGDLYELLLFGSFMFVVAYLGAWVVWLINERKQLVGEIAYLAILASLFLARTIALYREAMAATG